MTGTAERGALAAPRGMVATVRRASAVVLTVALIAVAVYGAGARHHGFTLSSDGLRRAAPLGAPPAVAPGGGSFAFVMQQPGEPGRPVAFDPCRVIEVEVNDALAPPGSEGIVESALREVSAATGLALEVVGTTDRVPEPGGQRFFPRRAPVVIGWTTPEEVAGLEGAVAGLGGSTARRHVFAGRAEYVTGAVALDAPQLDELLRHHGGDYVRAIVLHELAHVLGLDHVDDPGELMNAENHGRVTFGPGDREGLAALGSGSCFF